MYDFGKENKRRLREIQRRCKEQEAERAQSRPVPVKALWTSSKFQDVPSKVMVQLQVRVSHKSLNYFIFPPNHFSIASFVQASSPDVKPHCQNFLRAHSKSASAPPRRPPSKPSDALQRSESYSQNLQVSSTQTYVCYNYDIDLG